MSVGLGLRFIFIIFKCVCARAHLHVCRLVHMSVGVHNPWSWTYRQLELPNVSARN